ncbi:putative mitogen-activated protein kinase HOG1 [Coleophoma cylindrospora]|uniref:non-specific serine/threonine protein kinase n=1 Tax=Coleophoma cylindrospora TaxID=1849047 RepID=A0A3D8R1V8_9HELO|nr:putative mitogen-activated protein kinase HOG1 [Coleophoma cylindrospora]
MAAIRARNGRQPFEIHHDDQGSESMDEEDERMMEESQAIDEEDMQDDGYSDSDDSDLAVDPVVQEDMDKFQETFKGIKNRFRLINRIGEGTFSTVYKAEDLLYEEYDNDWDIEEKENPSHYISPPVKRQKLSHFGLPEYTQQKRRPKYVAIKKIYVTSSPARILNEIELLNDLRGCRSVCPLITAFRHTDQVVAVLPYFRHTDFREYFRKMTVPDMQIYFRSLFTALDAVHDQGILHRDIKPTNFLYEPDKKRGVLVDFGLAEREGTDCKPCICMLDSGERRRRVHASVAAQVGPASGYPKNDSRPSRRANRAGTRGFRAPEVLFKCTDQTTKIDIWSAGVILLTILSKRFPFFNSTDDIEAMIEIATIFGQKRMKQCALLHGTVFETSIPTIGQAGFTLEKIILWSTCRNDGGDGEIPLTSEEKLAVRFLERCFELDPHKRISAKEALEHPFLKIAEEEEDLEEEEMDEMHML